MTLMLGNLVLKEKALSTEQTENLFKKRKKTPKVNLFIFISL